MGNREYVYKRVDSAYRGDGDERHFICVELIFDWYNEDTVDNIYFSIHVLTPDLFFDDKLYETIKLKLIENSQKKILKFQAEIASKKNSIVNLHKKIKRLETV